MTRRRELFGGLPRVFVGLVRHEAREVSPEMTVWSLLWVGAAIGVAASLEMVGVWHACRSLIGLLLDVSK